MYSEAAGGVITTLLHNLEAWKMTDNIVMVLRLMIMNSMTMTIVMYGRSLMHHRWSYSLYALSSIYCVIVVYIEFLLWGFRHCILLYLYSSYL